VCVMLYVGKREPTDGQDNQAEKSREDHNGGVSRTYRSCLHETMSLHKYNANSMYFLKS